MSLSYSSLNDVRQDYYLRTHLESNFYPPLSEYAYNVANKAIKKWGNGDRSSEVVEIIEALELWSFVED
jgi:hypothetical protein